MLEPSDRPPTVAAVSVVGSLFAVGFLAELFGYMTHQLSVAIGLFLLAGVWVAVVSQSRRPQSWGLLIFALVLQLTAVRCLALDIPARLAAVVILLVGLQVQLLACGCLARGIKTLQAAILLFAIYIAAVESNPPLQLGADRLAGAMAATVAGWVGQPLDIGRTITGIDVIVFVFAYMLVRRIREGRDGSIRFVWALGLLAAAWIIYLAILAQWTVPATFGMPNKSPGERAGGFALFVSHAWPWNAPFLLGILAVPAMWVAAARKKHFTAAPVYSPRTLWALAGALCLLIPLFLWVARTPNQNTTGREIVYLSKPAMNWMKPNYESFGSKSAGRFGLVPDLLAATGWPTRKIDHITPETVGGAKTIIIINPEDTPDAEVDALWDLISQEGCSLFMMGDHTAIKGKERKNWCNVVLRDSHIRFNFDTTELHSSHWQHSYRYGNHPAIAGLGDQYNEGGFFVGASLETLDPAQPVITIKYGFADKGVRGDTTNRGGMGNRSFDRGERLGDFVYSAAENVGNGKVFVVGDTSGYSNPAIFNSHELIIQTFQWLQSDAGRPVSLWKTYVGVLLLVVAFACFAFARHSPICLPLAALAAFVAFTVPRQVLPACPPQPPVDKSVVVDSSHGTYHNRLAWGEESYMGLGLNVLRAGYFPRDMLTFSKDVIDQAKLLIVGPPLRPYSESELDVIEDYVKRGGTLFLNIGWEESGPAKNLLDRFGFVALDGPHGFLMQPIIDVTATPLRAEQGEFSTRAYLQHEGKGVYAKFWEPWPVGSVDKIQRASLEVSQGATPDTRTDIEDLVTSGLIGPKGIVLDSDAGKMYWTDVTTNKIQRANLDGSNVEDLVTSGLEFPVGIALDTVGGKMYWVDRGVDKIRRADLDGSNVEDWVTTGLQAPEGIALDVTGGKMYWTDVGTRNIRRAGLDIPPGEIPADRTDIEDLVTLVSAPVGIALDATGGKMYWTDRGARKIQRADLDGSNMEDLIGEGLSSPIAIALNVAAGKMYWADRGTDKIQRANLDGSNIEDLITEGLDIAEGIALDVSNGRMYWTVEEGDVVCEYKTFDYDPAALIMVRRYGDNGGRVWIAGDTAWWFGQNLESDKEVVSENVDFLKWFLATQINR